MLFVDGVNVRVQKRAERIKEGVIEVGNADDGEVIRFGELPSQLGWVTLVKGGGHKDCLLYTSRSHLAAADGGENQIEYSISYRSVAYCLG